LFLGGRALREDALALAGRIAKATGCRLICETFPARLQRGAGRIEPERLPYFAEMAVEHLQGLGRIVFVGARPPVAFFAYPGKPSWLSPEEAENVELAPPWTDALDALERLAAALQADTAGEARQPQELPPAPDGPLDAQSLGSVVAELMPEGAIVSDEAATAGLTIFPLTAGAPAHDWLTLTGGSIGQGLPVAAGAAVACPQRKVIALQADGSAMYTVQALWTIAREDLDVTTVIINNGSYAILNIELARVGVADPGPKALSLLDLTHPTIDWVSVSEGLGIPAARAETVQDFRQALGDALSEKGPRLVEAVIPAGVG
ncbi:MAG: acetolactate synthase large subunit, partial [Gammaproteobacteria bacterium]